MYDIVIGFFMVMVMLLFVLMVLAFIFPRAFSASVYKIEDSVLRKLGG